MVFPKGLSFLKLFSPKLESGVARGRGILFLSRGRTRDVLVRTWRGASQRPSRLTVREAFLFQEKGNGGIPAGQKRGAAPGSLNAAPGKKLHLRGEVAWTSGTSSSAKGEGRNPKQPAV